MEDLVLVDDGGREDGGDGLEHAEVEGDETQGEDV